MKSQYDEVARIAGVSRATVYRVMNSTRHRGGRAGATAARVRAAAAKVGLSSRSEQKTPILARLRGNRTVLHPFHSRILVGAENHCMQHDYGLIVMSLHYPSNVGWKQLHLPRLLQLHGVVDGFIVAGINSQNLLDFLFRTGMPFAVLGDCMQSPWDRAACDTVCFDAVGGASRLTRYLYSLGHRDIWFVGDSQFTSFGPCYEGYEQAMIEAGLTPRIQAFDCEKQREAGYLSARSILARGERVTAIVANSDPAAVGVYEALRECGLRVPDDISVVGFDDIEASTLQPPLTTAHIFLQEMGRELARFVLNRFANPDLPPQQVSIPTRIVRRESCSAPSSAAQTRIANDTRLRAEPRRLPEAGGL